MNFGSIALSAQRILLPFELEPYLRVTMNEKDAPRAGSYWFDGNRTCRVVRVERPKDWFDPEVVVVLTNGPIEYNREHEPGGAFQKLLRRLPIRAPWLNDKVRWLDDYADSTVEDHL